VSEVTQVVAPQGAPASRLLLLARDHGTALLVALVVFVVAYDNGGAAESARDTLAILIWWAVVLAVGLGIWPLVRTPLGAFVTGALLATFGLFTLLSTAWAANAGGAYAEFTRVALYLGVFVLVVVATTRGNGESWANGLALGIAAIAVVAIISRLFPSTFPDSNREIARFLPEGSARLNFPLGYWNGLAVFVALGIPLLLRIAVGARAAVARGLALVPIPAIAGIIYLASSRVGVVTAFVAAAVFILLTDRRWSAVVASFLAAAGSAAVVFALYDRTTLVDGPLGSALAHSQGRSAALIIAGVCVLVGVLYGAGTKAFAGELHPHPILGWTLFVVAVGLAAVGIAAAHPKQRFDAFKQPPASAAPGKAIERHLLSKSGNGRWQLWQAAWKEFKSKPVNGHGAGSYQAWWARHGTLPGFIQDAHSLYLQVLGELGIIGLVLLVGAFLAGLAAAARRLLRAEGEQRIVLAASSSVFVAFAVAAAVDWMWQLTIVSVVAFVCLGIAAGPATAFVDRPRPAQPGDRPPRSRFGKYGLGAAIIACGWLLIVAIAIPLLAGAKLTDSHDAAGRGDATAALNNALAARSIEPWSAEPYLQVALVAEEENALGAANLWIRRAIKRDPSDWRLWLTQARLQTKVGNIRAGKRSLERARILNPRSPIFQGS
jgi:O-antigen ligase